MRLKRYLRPAGLVLGLVATAAFAWYAMRVLQERDLSRFASPTGTVAVVVAALLYMTGFPVNALAWRTLLRGLGEPTNARSLLEILAISQFAKYIPGNVGAHLGRAAMAMARGLGTRPIVGSLVTEALLAAAAALMVGAAGIALSGAGTQVLASNGLGSGLATATWIVVACLSLWMAIRFAPRGLRERLSAHHAWPPMPAMLRAFSAYTLNYIVIGLGTWAMAAMLLPDRTHDIGLLIAAFALAWVAGFFAPGAPAGLGIRETLMLLLLRTSYPAPDALMLVVGMRLATVLGDVVTFLAGNIAVLQARRRSPSR
jgi:hypothetical protein